MMLLLFERGIFVESYSDHDIQMAVRMRVEPLQNCYIAQIPGHTNCAHLVRQPFSSNTGLRFSGEMAVATVGPFQMLRLP
jgi:dTDP-4-dehydrorhamnose 3,5-epimerase-like enzyme